MKDIKLTITFGQKAQRIAIRLAVLAPVFLIAHSGHFHDQRTFWEKQRDTAVEMLNSAGQAVKCLGNEFKDADPLTYNRDRGKSGLEIGMEAPDKCAPRGMKAYRLLRFFEHVLTLGQ